MAGTVIFLVTFGFGGVVGIFFGYGRGVAAGAHDVLTDLHQQRTETFGLRPATGAVRPYDQDADQ